MRVTVEEREILINSLWVVIDEPHFKVLGGDLRSKYAQAGGVSQHGSTIELLLWADPFTQYRGDSTESTQVTLHMDSDNAVSWHVYVDVARYSLYVAMWQSHLQANYSDVDNVIWTTTREHVSRETW